MKLLNELVGLNLMNAGSELLKGLIKDKFCSSIGTTLEFNDGKINVDKDKVWYLNTSLEAYLFWSLFHTKYNSLKLIRLSKNPDVEDYYSFALIKPSNGFYWIITNKGDIVTCVVQNNFSGDDYELKRGITDPFILLLSYKFYSIRPGNIMKYYRDKVIVKYEKMRIQRRSHKTFITIYHKSSNTTYFPPTRLSNVFMDDYNKDFLRNKLNTFIKSRDLYSKFNLKHRMGILLYGEPGVGKSLLARSIALEFGLSICQWTPQDIVNDVKMMGSTSNDMIDANFTIVGEHVSPRIIFIEEIDALFDDVTYSSKEKAQEKLRRDEILGWVDNLPDNTILVATTNHIDKIDPALIRPGRFSVKIEMNKLDREMAERMVKKYELEPYPLLDKYEFPVSPAELEFDCINLVYEKLENL